MCVSVRACVREYFTVYWCHFQLLHPTVQPTIFTAYTPTSPCQNGPFQTNDTAALSYPQNGNTMNDTLHNTFNLPDLQRSDRAQSLTDRTAEELRTSG